MLRRLPTLVLVLLLALLVRAHVVLLIGGPPAPVVPAWPDASTVTYRLNNQIPGGAFNLEPGSNAVVAIDNAMATIAAASGLNLVNAGTTTLTEAAVDGTNLVSFANTQNNLALTAGLTGISFTYVNTQTGNIFEFDVIGSPTSFFSTQGNPSAFDLEGMVVHEAGHGVGLDHSPLFHATMYPVHFTNTFGRRALAEDDLEALRRLYPSAPSVPVGTVTGTLLRPPGQPVAGGHVLLVDHITGRVVTGTLSLADGTFTLQQVPPGLYELYAEPLDGPFTPAALIGTYWQSVTVTTAFRTAILGGTGNPTVVDVDAGQTSNVGAFNVTALPPGRNLSQVFFNTTPTPAGSVSTLEQVAPYTGFAGIFGASVDQIPDAAFRVTGPFHTITGPSTWSSPGPPFSDKIFPLSVRADAPPGAYLLRVDDPLTGELVVFGGCLRVLPPPAPRGWSAAYGSPCGGGAGTVTLGVTGPPDLGNAGFGLTVTGTAPGQPVFFFLSTGAGQLALAPGCTVGLDPTTFLFPIPGIAVTAAGTTTTLPLPLPADPALAGLELHAQVLLGDPQSPNGFALTNALKVHLD